MASMSLQAAYDQARQSLESSDLDRAIGLAQHILDHYPDNLEAYRILGEAYLANRQLDRAQESFERVLRSDPENIPAHVGLGITVERQGKLDRAIAEFEQALEIKPDMTELRSQLLRLYSEGFGSENAQLRLSRAGLARLYAKGHMLPQAINEFRQVISDQPGRFDAMVALAEALWRDGQEDEAIDLCRDILAERPESLKANLLLGYLLSSAGQPEGERYWQAALRMDPYQGVARALFETLPQEPAEQPMIDEWDEVAWRNRRAAEQQEQIAATRPMEVVTPVGTPSDVAAVADTGWEPAVAAPASVGARSAALPAETDDFLASLLALDTAPPPPSSPAAPVSEEELGLDANMLPFSLEDLDRPPAAPPSAPSTPVAPAEEPGMMPFSLSDLGLSDEEIAGLESASTPTPSTPAAPEQKETEEEPGMTPFSLSDLGLSDEEIAGLESAGTPTPSTPAAPEQKEAEEEPGMTPFSLSDLGLSDEEIAGLESAGTPTPSAPASSDDEPGLSPFSLSDLGLSEEEMAGLDSLQSRGSQPSPSTPAQPSFGDLSRASEEADEGGELPVDLQPFSFDDLDLNAETEPSSRIGGLPSSLQPFSLDETPPQRPRVGGFSTPEAQENEGALDEEPDMTTEPRGFSWQQASQKSEPGFVKPPRPDPLVGDVSIFSKLKQQYNQETRTEPPLPPVSIEPDEHMGLFSLDDISLRDDADEHVPPPSAPEPQASAAEPEPAKPEPEIENLEDALASGQVQPFSFADLGLSDEEIAALGMRETPAAEPEPAKPEPEIENLEDALASGQVQPFSFADLGLSEEEQALLGGGTSEPAASVPPSEPAKPEPEIENLEDALASGQVQPFSFADLGLTPEEMAMLEGSAGAGAPADTDAAPEVDNLQDALASGQVQPFSLSDLGLSEEEIAAMGGTEAEEAGAAPTPEVSSQFEDFDVEPPASPAAPSTAQSGAGTGEDEPLLTNDIQPFSLNDLGLSEEEIESLGLDIGSSLGDTDDMSLGLTEEELEGLDGGDLNWALQPSVPSTPPAEAAPAEQAQPPAQSSEPQVTTGDLVVDRLIALGRQQGFVDISDIIANFEDPEAEAARIEEIGMRLHEAKIEIRDGDEVIDMEAEYAEEAEEMAEPAPEPQPPPRPSVSRDLDLVSDDFDVPTAEAPSEEPAMTPFSLSDLGLTEEEIAALGLGEATPDAAAALAEQAAAPEAPATEPPTAEAPSEESAMTPFSLSDLGLTEEEIAALGLGDATPAEPAEAISEAPSAEVPSEEIEQPSAEPTQVSSTPEAAPADAAAEAPAAEAPSEEPVMTPFSLSDLGLTEEEIAALGLEPSGEGVATPLPSETPAGTPDDAILSSLLDTVESPSAEVRPAELPVAEPPAAEAPTAPAQSEPVAPPAPPAAPVQGEPAQPRAAAAPAVPAEARPSAGDDVLDMFLRQLEAEPDNDVLRLSVARAGTQIGQTDLAMQQYRYLIRHSRLLDTVVGELQDLIADNEDVQVLQRLHRTLGDAYSKQGRLREAIEEYSWTLGGPRGAR